MRKILLEHAKKGDVVGRNLYSSNGNILLSAGIRLTDKYIEKLQELGVDDIYIKDGVSKDIFIEDAIKEETLINVRKNMAEEMDKIKLSRTEDAYISMKLIGNIMEYILENKDVVVNLADIRSTNEYTFTHSVNVCVLSLVLGLSLGYDRQRLLELGTGALLHDIGKNFIPNDIINKLSPLTPEEYELVKTHTSRGYEVLRENKNIPELSSYVALAHHERYDGTGYPLGKRGEDIHEYARIVSIADVFDAITSKRPYKMKENPSRAVDYLISMESRQFDEQLLSKFLESIAVYPIGSKVKLSDGSLGLVISENREMPTRPIVRIIYDRKGNRMNMGEMVDLMKHPTMFIKEDMEQVV